MDIVCTTLYVAIAITSAFVVPAWYPLVFASGFLLFFYLYWGQALFATAMFGLAVLTVIHNMILQRREQPVDDCASFRWKDVFGHGSLFMSSVTAAYISLLCWRRC